MVKVYNEQTYLLSFQVTKWFGRDIKLFIQTNKKSIRSWIKVAKKLISQRKRKQLKDKEHPITIYFHHLTSIIQPSSLPLQDTSDKENNQIPIEDSALQLNTNERGLSPVLNNKQQHINNSLIVVNSIPAQPNIIHPPPTNITTKEIDHVVNYKAPSKVRDPPHEMIPTVLIEYPPTQTPFVKYTLIHSKHNDKRDQPEQHSGNNIN